MVLDYHIKNITNVICDYFPDLSNDSIQIQETRKEFVGDFTIIVFPLVRFSKKNVIDTAQDLGLLLVRKVDYIVSFNVVKGFLNLEFHDSFWYSILEKSFLDNFEINSDKSKSVVVESCSPNTNKPLHLGHLRNIVLGDSVSNILEADGYNVTRVQIINDRGIHICKSMLAWLKFANGATPETSDLKGDHFVGKYYVLFDKKYQEEIETLCNKGLSMEEAKSQSVILHEAQKMLQNWELGDPDIVSLWNKMNSWVYDGFELTYSKIGVHFDKIYYESNTYILGKEYISKGVQSDIFYVNSDNSIWVNLDDYSLDPKLLLRSDGTTVYMTQDLGTAILRYEEINFDQMIYVVGNEQNHHFKVLFSILNKMNFQWANNLHHLSYGMVNLPDGKMKSREGNVIDIDDLISEMHAKAKEMIIQSNRSNLDSIDELSTTIGDAALKYFILKPDPRKEILFNSEESIDFNGHTGPFIQYTYARINSVLWKSKTSENTFQLKRDLLNEEKQIIKLILNYPLVIKQSAKELNPSFLASYLYSLSKEYNHFYQKIPILKTDDADDMNFRLTISKKVGILIKKGMSLLGINVPNKM
tara:strand:+ start:140 stop:1897 length:1758 start_codon:yes stop_codon:yes gene_type:complete